MDPPAPAPSRPTLARGALTARMELAHASRSGWIAYAWVDPRLDPLRGESRLGAVLPQRIPVA